LVSCFAIEDFSNLVLERLLGEFDVLVHFRRKFFILESLQENREVRLDVLNDLVSQLVAQSIVGNGPPEDRSLEIIIVMDEVRRNDQWSQVASRRPRLNSTQSIDTFDALLQYLRFPH